MNILDVIDPDKAQYKRNHSDLGRYFNSILLSICEDSDKTGDQKWDEIGYLAAQFGIAPDHPICSPEMAQYSQDKADIEKRGNDPREMASLAMQWYGTDDVFWDDKSDTKHRKRPSTPSDIRAQIAKENKTIVLQNYYVLSGKRISFRHKLNEHQKVEVITPEHIAALLSPVDQTQKAGKLDAVPDISVVNADSFEPATELVMNFANAYHPGGGYLRGAPAQEEALCRESTLYASISSRPARVMYETNRHTDNPLNSDYMLISPCVEVFRDGDNQLLEKPKTTAVLTIAAPNIAYDHKIEKANLTQGEIDRYMVRRLYQFCMVCVEKGYKSLTLGAWGCGAFGHKPEKVAGYFEEVLFGYNMKQYFDKIVFAVKTGKDTHNYDVFRSVFQRYFSDES